MSSGIRLGWARAIIVGQISAIVSACSVLGAACGSPSSPTGFGSDDGGSGSGGSSGAGPGSSSGSGASGGNGSSGGSTGSNSGSGADGGGGSSSGSGGGTGSSSSSSGATADDGGACAITSSNVRVTEVDVGVTYLYQEVDSNPGNTVGLAPLAISPMPSGGSRLAFIGNNDNLVHIAQLDGSDNLVANSVFGLPAFDFQDIYADDKGGVVLVSRDALGGSTADHHCGNINNLCGPAATYPTNDYCWDMHLVRFDGTTETWDAKLTDTSATLPAYGVSATTGGNVVFIWWYAHNGRIAFDGSNYGAYFGAAITVPNAGCVTPPPAMGVNIHQGDRLKIVSSAGVVQSGGFSFGCSHSAFERVIWDPTAKKFVTACENDLPTGGASGTAQCQLVNGMENNAIGTAAFCLSGRLAFAGPTTTIYAMDLSYSNFGNLLPAAGGGYWFITSNFRTGQPGGMKGLADVVLVHATTGPPDKPVIVVASDPGLNDRAPHLAAFGTHRMLAAWETSTTTGDLAQNDRNRKLYVQALNATTGTAEGASFNVAGVTGSRYQDFRSFPDGSVAYPAPGSTNTKIKIARVMPCP
jgi:hypothetical protein